MAAPLSVRFVTRKFPPAMGGMETYCARLVEHLGSRVNLDLVALPGRPDGSAPGALRLLGFGAATAFRLLVSPSRDVVHVADMASWPLAWIAALRGRGQRIVLSAHGSDVSYSTRGHWRGRLYGVYLRLGARMLGNARIIANSRFVAETAAAHGFRNVAVVAPGTSLAPPADSAAMHDSLLFAGRIMRGKGLRFLVEEVLPLLPYPPRLRVAGTIWDQDEAEALASPLVDYLGPLDPQSLAREYAGALAVVVPTIIPEGFGLVAAEGAACGGLVLASDHSGLRDAVLPGHGILVGPSAQDWADAIEMVRAIPPSERADRRLAASAAALRHFSWERVAGETVAIYAGPKAAN